MKKNIALSIVLMFTVSACSSQKSSDRYREGDNAGQKVDLTVDQEKQLTKEALAEMKKDYPAVKNRELQAYIEKMGHKIVNANNLNNKPYTYNFTAVDSDQVNAFALPAGEVFITAPIIAMADSEAEIAGVLGHEIGHVVARHTAERMYVAKKSRLKLMSLVGLELQWEQVLDILLKRNFAIQKIWAVRRNLSAVELQLVASVVSWFRNMVS